MIGHVSLWKEKHAQGQRGGPHSLLIQEQLTSKAAPHTWGNSLPLLSITVFQQNSSNCTWQTAPMGVITKLPDLDPIHSALPLKVCLGWTQSHPDIWGCVIHKVRGESQETGAITNRISAGVGFTFFLKQMTFIIHAASTWILHFHSSYGHKESTRLPNQQDKQREWWGLT